MEQTESKREGVVAVLREDGRVLVIRRGPGVPEPGYWAPLSGTVEPGEAQPDTLVREVYEEVGLRVAPLGKVWESASADGRFVLHWWTAEITGGELTLDPREVSEARWVTVEEYRQLEPTFAGDHAFFADVLPGL